MKSAPLGDTLQPSVNVLIPQMFNHHPKRPSEARIQELADPWNEEALSALPQQNGVLPVEFVVHFHPTSLFSTDPNFLKSVHLCGDSLEEERQSSIRAAAQEWQSKMVVNSKNLRFFQPVRAKVNQTDRKEKLLKVSILLGGDR